MHITVKTLGGQWGHRYYSVLPRFIYLFFFLGGGALGLMPTDLHPVVYVHETGPASTN